MTFISVFNRIDWWWINPSKFQYNAYWWPWFYKIYSLTVGCLDWYMPTRYQQVGNQRIGLWLTFLDHSFKPLLTPSGQLMDKYKDMVTLSEVLAEAMHTAWPIIRFDKWHIHQKYHAVRLHIQYSTHLFSPSNPRHNMVSVTNHVGQKVIVVNV